MADTELKNYVFIEDEMKKSYLDYSMSMITSRALPDVRDGLKPVHRRVLFGMHELNLVHNKQPKKCARVVGDVIGKYHPHGDMPVYDTLVRMAQPFSLRYCMVDGQGNFGSVDGDPPAAMRYTECRLTRLAEEMLADLEKETVPFIPNYDESMEEPTVLPSKIPSLLINGSTGIAVGMATNMPPHNLGEVIDAVVAVIENPDITLDKLLVLLPGPDFPTGGLIYGRAGIVEAYKTGRGKVVVRGRCVVEKENDREHIIVTEIPYMTNKSMLLERMVELVRNKALEDITSIRDESDRTGMRIVIGIRKEAFGDVVLNQLFKFTGLQATFGIINLALVNRQPKTLTLIELITLFIDHRHTIVVKRAEFDLRKARERAHILEGLRLAVDHIDEIITLIKSSASPDEALKKLLERFDLTPVQGHAILDMRLARLTGLERDKIEQEYKELMGQIAALEDLLAHREKRMAVIKEELIEIKKKFNDPRRTEIVDAGGELVIEDMIADEDMVITMTGAGYIKRCPVAVYRSQGRGGKGIKGMDSKEDDFVKTLFIASAHSYILFFTNKGRCHWLKVYRIPEAGRQARGRPIVNLLELQSGEGIASFVPVREFDDRHFIVTVTQRGIINKQPLNAYDNIRKDGINAIKLEEQDRLIESVLTDGTSDIIIGTKNGLAVRFHESMIRELGRNTRGVRGISLREGDAAIGMVIATQSDAILTVTENGYGKRTLVSEYRCTNRGGIGIINIKCTERNGTVVGIKKLNVGSDVMCITRNGIIIRSAGNTVSLIGRNTQGVKLINLDEGDSLIDIAVCDNESEGGQEMPCDTQTEGSLHNAEPAPLLGHEAVNEMNREEEQEPEPEPEEEDEPEEPPDTTPEDEE